MATFERQARNAGLADEWIVALKAASVDALGKLSYAVAVPGTPVTNELLLEFTNTVRPGVRPTISASSALKRLIFESQTFAVAALKSAVSSRILKHPEVRITN